MKKYIYIILIGAFGLVAFKADDYFEISKNLDIFASVYKEVNTSYVDEVQPGQLIRAAIDGMLGSLDPYTNFYSEAQKEDYQYQVTGTYAGIGSTIRKIEDHIYIDSPYEGFPAHKAGLLPGDKILSIDGKDMAGKSTSEITEFLKGNAGTTVNVLLEREGEGNITKSITRANIKMKNVPYFGMMDDVGYIKLTGFTPNAGKEVMDAVLNLKDQGATSLILDLRNNGGGLLHEAINIVNVFVDKGKTIVTTKGKYVEDNKEYKTLNSPVDTKIPLAVLINGSSASASEIVSGSLQDLDRAVLIGRNSFGKGLVQTTRPLTYNTQMKITTAKYYIPSGRLIQRLDYGNKKNGRVEAVADSAKKTFYTLNNRPVIDGEGIQPDIEIEVEPYTEVTTSLIRNNLIFKFASIFRSKNPTIDEAKAFNISDGTYAEFVSFLSDKDYEYTTKTESYLNKLIERAKQDNYFELLEPELDELEKSLQSSKENDLTINKDEIKEYLEFEIAKRYYFEKGKIEIGFDDDPDLTSTIDILENSTKMSKILGK